MSPDRAKPGRRSTITPSRLTNCTRSMSNLNPNTMDESTIREQANSLLKTHEQTLTELESALVRIVALGESKAILVEEAFKQGYADGQKHAMDAIADRPLDKNVELPIEVEGEDVYVEKDVEVEITHGDMEASIECWKDNAQDAYKEWLDHYLPVHLSETTKSQEKASEEVTPTGHA